MGFDKKGSIGRRPVSPIHTQTHANTSLLSLLLIIIINNNRSAAVSGGAGAGAPEFLVFSEVIRTPALFLMSNTTPVSWLVCKPPRRGHESMDGPPDPWGYRRG